MSVYCPACGYDLRAIPEIRCPECGFGFDRRAIDDTAVLEFERRFSAYSGMLIRASFGCAFALSDVLRSFGVDRGAGILLIVGALVAAMLVKRRYSRYPTSGILDLYPSTPVCLILILFVAQLLPALPGLGSILAAGFLLDAALTHARGSGGLPHAEVSLPQAGKVRLKRYRTAAFLAAAACGVMILIPWT